MNNYERAGQLRDTAGVLTGVKYAVFDESTLVGVELAFGSAVASFHAESEFDTVRIALSALDTSTLGRESGPEGVRVVDATKIEPWSGAIGHRAMWIWLLQNQQGYEDGIRFEFASPEDGVGHAVELLVCASAFRVYGATEYPFAPPRPGPNHTI